MPDFAQAMQRVALVIFPLLFGIICHEVAHGYTAYLLGDPTAKRAGRLNFNPAHHLDPVGSTLFIMLALFSPVVIGWAKPVPVNFSYFKKPRRDMFLVSLAGPAANILVALLFALAWKALIVFAGHPQTVASFIRPLYTIFQFGVIINVLLAFFNLLPVPPLDGSKIVASMLPREAAIRYLSLGRYGLLIILGLLFLDVIEVVIWPLALYLADLFLSI